MVFSFYTQTELICKTNSLWDVSGNHPSGLHRPADGSKKDLTMRFVF
jgi:hypothetical protein